MRPSAPATSAGTGAEAGAAAGADGCRGRGPDRGDGAEDTRRLARDEPITDAPRGAGENHDWRTWLAGRYRREDRAGEAISLEPPRALHGADRAGVAGEVRG